MQRQATQSLGREGDLKQALNASRQQLSKLETQMTAARNEAATVGSKAKDATQKLSAAEQALQDR